MSIKSFTMSKETADAIFRAAARNTEEGDDPLILANIDGATIAIRGTCVFAWDEEDDTIGDFLGCIDTDTEDTICACGGPKRGDQAYCLACAICKADVQETEAVQDDEGEEYEKEADDEEDCGICAQCLRTYEGEGFHGFCGPTCAAARHGTICHCCYE